MNRTNFGFNVTVVCGLLLTSALWAAPTGPGEGGRGGNGGGGTGGGGGPRPPRPTPTVTATPTPTPTPTPSDTPRPPRPTPTPSVTPTPTPTPTATVTPPTPTPTPVDTGPAQRAGERAGFQDGQREGSVRGPVEGEKQGREEGWDRGFGRCEREQKERARDFGYREGFALGDRDGIVAGQAVGARDGEARGLTDGTNDGTGRANSDAYRVATPLGRDQGIADANNSDATARGLSDGAARGDQEALARAQAEDYPRGRTDYREERFAEPVSSDDQVAQNQLAFQSEATTLETKPVVATGFWAGIKNTFATLMDTKPGDRRGGGNDRPGNGGGNNGGGDRGNHNGRPDKRFYHPDCAYNTPQETNACTTGYDSGYTSGFDNTYDRAFQDAFRGAFRRAEEQGCERANRGDYRRDYQAGFDRGRVEGYDRAYKANYDATYRAVYATKFREASDGAYQQNYNGFYQKHFDAARSAAYGERVGQLYQAAFAQGREAKFNEMRPKYGQQEYNRGRADEAEDFRLRPVRLLNAQIVESIPNGIMEPGERLRVKIQVRNFSDKPVMGKDVRVQLAAATDAALITQSDVLLSRNLKGKSVTTITEVIEFRLTENRIGMRTPLTLNVSYQNRNVGNQDFSLVARYMLAVSFAEAPVLHEGMASDLRIRVKNISNAASDAGTKIFLKVDSAAVELLTREVLVGALAAGEEKIVSFSAIARTGGRPDVRFAVETNEASGRRTGLLNEIREVPVMNDYTLNLTQAPSGLRAPGIIRAEYVLKNVSSRKVMSSLQLYARITSKEDGALVVLGPNPQFLTPLMNGQSMKFVLPILVKNANSGGVLEIEVKEAGQTVVIHRAEF